MSDYKPTKISISSNDFSRFLFTDLQKIVNIKVGDEVFPCSSIILAQNSKPLEKLVKDHDQLNLSEDYAGLDDVDGVKDCLRLLYGENIFFTLDNIQTILAFSIHFKIGKMYEEAIDWVKEQFITKDDEFVWDQEGDFMNALESQEDARWKDSELPNVFKMLFHVGYFLRAFVQDNYKYADVISVLRSNFPTNRDGTNYRSEETGLDTSEFFLPALKELISDPTVKDPRYLVDFIIDKKHFKLTLELLISMVNAETTKYIISGLDKNLAHIKDFLRAHEKTSDLFAKLELAAGATDLQNQVTELKKHLYMNTSKADVTTLLRSKKWRSFSEDQILQIKSEFDLEPFMFVEIMLDWFDHQKCGPEVISRCIMSIKRLTDLHPRYVKDVKQHVLRSHGEFSLDYSQYKNPRWFLFRPCPVNYEIDVIKSSTPKYLEKLNEWIGEAVTLTIVEVMSEDSEGKFAAKRQRATAELPKDFPLKRFTLLVTRQIDLRLFEFSGLRHFHFSDSESVLAENMMAVQKIFPAYFSSQDTATFQVQKKAPEPKLPAPALVGYTFKPGETRRKKRPPPKKVPAPRVPTPIPPLPERTIHWYLVARYGKKEDEVYDWNEAAYAKFTKDDESDFHTEIISPISNTEEEFIAKLKACRDKVNFAYVSLNFILRIRQKSKDNPKWGEEEEEE